MTDDRITGAEAQALLDAATPGPWEYPPDSGEVSALEDDWLVVSFGYADRSDDYEADAALIAAAPRLARTVVALEEELRQAREVVVWLERQPEFDDELREWQAEEPGHYFETLAAARAQEKADE